MKVFRKLMMVVILGGAVAGADENYEGVNIKSAFTGDVTNGTEVVSSLGIQNNTLFTDEGEANFVRFNLPANLVGRDFYNLESYRGWTNEVTGANTSSMVATNGGYDQGVIDQVSYSVQTDEIVGKETITSNMETEFGDQYFFPHEIHMTRSTLTSNGVPLGAIVDSGLATNMSSRAEYEDASLIDNNSNSVPDAIDWLVGGSTNYTGGFTAAITITNDSSVVSWIPSVSNRVYGILSCSNLASNVWSEVVSVTNAGEYAVSNMNESVFFKVDVDLP